MLYICDIIFDDFAIFYEIDFEVGSILRQPLFYALLY